MVYAPVVIATLNRYEHFKRCIESLEKNAWAKYTEVYISVDFPPEDKYVEGRKHIIEYLKSRTFLFKETNVFYQTENMGAAKNSIFVKEKAYEKYDRLIIAEDDNEFSPNFLEFVDKALEFGESDKKILYVCGFSDTIKKPKDMQGTAFVQRASCAWGRGVYREKEIQLLNILSKQWIDDIIADVGMMIRIFRKSRMVFYNFFGHYVIRSNPAFFYEDGTPKSVDIIAHVYMIVNDMYSIMPTISTVRNWGHDGTGQNCGKWEDISADKQEFDTKDSFDFKLETDERINRIIGYRWCRYKKDSTWVVWKALFYYFYLHYTHKI